MKITAIILLSACLQVSANGYSQTITLAEKNASLEKIFSEIKRQSDYTFAYTESLLSKAKTVSIFIKDGELEEVLNLCFSNQPFTYTIIEKTIVVRPAPIPVIQSPDISLLRQSIDIRGRVTNENSEPVAASIVVKGTKNGTTSNNDGYFELKNVDESATLVISGINIEAREIKINGRSDIGSIALITKAVEGKEVVVKTNYWETKQKFNPGNISKVPAKEIEKSPASNPLQALQGRVPGLEIVQETGVLGGNFRVRIRGTNSIANGNVPLFIIDGVPFVTSSLSLNEASGEILSTGTSPLNLINPSDIESIEVLKDADATAIYGSRGSNGVILITTKRGKPGSIKFDFNFYAGAGKVASKVDLLTTQEYLEMRNEAFRNDNVVINSSNAPDLLVWDTTRYTDWQETLIGGTANITDAQFSLSGGNNNTQYLVGTGYRKETTVFPGSDADKRTSFHFNLNTKSSNEKFKASFSGNYSSLRSNLVKSDLTGLALMLPPNAPKLYDANGNLNWEGSTWTNPISYTRNRYEASTSNLIGNAVISYAIAPSLEVKARFGYTKIDMDAITITPKSSSDPSFIFTDNLTAFSNSHFDNWTIEPQISWSKTVGKGRFDILAGTSFLEEKQSLLSQTGIGFSDEALMYTLAAAPIIFVSTDTYSQYKYNAFFGRFNFNLADKYILNLTGRRDASSRFGPGKQFANFGAAGFAWLFSSEKFVREKLSFISYGKLRASYGITGNDQLGDYVFLNTYASSGLYQGVPGLNPSRLFNSDFSWEENKKAEVGLELGFFLDKLIFSGSFYRNRSSNQLVGYSLPPTTGFLEIQGNLPALLQNSGVELELTTTNIATRDITWSSSFNLSIPKNKLVQYPDIESSSYANSYVVGEPLAIRKQYFFLGTNAATGLYEVKDVNADGVFNTIDRQSITFAGTRFFGGLQNKVTYKAFELDFLFQYVNQTASNYLVAWGEPPGSRNNQLDEVMNRWRKSGDQSIVQKFGTTGTPVTAYSRVRGSNAAVSDASFARLKNLALAYIIKPEKLSKMHLRAVRIFVQCANLLTFTKYRGLDPETQSNALPPLKMITGGIHLTF